MKGKKLMFLPLQVIKLLNCSDRN